MMPGMSPKKIQEMMKKMNMNVKEIKADEVIIKSGNKNTIISNPEVMVTNMMGKEVYQVSGEVSESENISEEDIKIVMEQTGHDRETVAQKLKDLDNDLAKAIMELKKKNK
jgi:nascent polypeptide-associated complex subunit alpha